MLSHSPVSFERYFTLKILTPSAMAANGTQEKFKISKQPFVKNNLLATTNCGNPVFSCVAGVTEVEDEVAYNKEFKIQNLMFKTSSNVYGEMKIMPETCASTHNVLDRRFTRHLGKCGMYRNLGLNTALDEHKVLDPPNF